MLTHSQGVTEKGKRSVTDALTAALTRGGGVTEKGKVRGGGGEWGIVWRGGKNVC